MVNTHDFAHLGGGGSAREIILDLVVDRCEQDTVSAGELVSLDDITRFIKALVNAYFEFAFG
jgi:hypothetical protein